METDADAYFAKHDIPSVVSDMLFELGFHRPKDVGKFMAAYVERRFRLTDTGGTGEKSGKVEGGAHEDDFGTIEVLNPLARSPQTADDGIACSLLEEARGLRKKYLEFCPQSLGRESGEGINNFRTLGKTELASITTISWKEFRADYERLLAIFSNPRVWSFCERRLALLRGLFDAHSALNEVAETAELSTAGMECVDTCVQLARSLAPSRLNDFFQRKMQEASADGEAAEVAPGKTLGDLAAELGRPPGPTDLTADVDAPSQPATAELAGVFSRTSNHIRGQFLAECVRQSFMLLEQTSAVSGGAMYAEYRVPLFPGPGAWEDLARWVAEFRVESARVQWVIQLPSAAYRSLIGIRSVLNFGEMLDNVFGPTVAAANYAKDADPSAETEEAQLSRLLLSVSGFELPAVNSSAEEPHQPIDLERDPWDWTMLSSPPYFYQLYHIWVRLKALNLCNEDSDLPLISLRCAANDAEPLACAYMLGVAGVSRCGCLAAHSPLQYLFALELDALIVSVSLCSKRSLGSGNGAKAFSELFRAGVTTALCTEDPTVSQQADNALDVEYALARSMLGLSQVDLTEIARNSMQTTGFRSAPALSQDSDGSPNASFAGQVKSIRERYRLGRRDAELRHIATLAELATGRSDQA